MNFFDSIAFPLQIWQTFCLSPFILPQISELILNKFQKSYFKKCTVIILTYLLVFSGFAFNYFRNNNDIFYGIWGEIVVFIFAIVIVAILLESFYKRNDQRKLLLQFEAIDSILKHQIDIEIDYVNEKQGHKNRLIRWISLNFFIITTAIFAAIINLDFSHIHFGIGFYVLCLFTILRLSQYTILVDIIRERFRLLNKHINTICSSDLH